MEDNTKSKEIYSYGKIMTDFRYIQDLLSALRIGSLHHLTSTMYIEATPLLCEASPILDAEVLTVWIVTVPSIDAFVDGILRFRTGPQFEYVRRCFVKHYQCAENNERL